MAAPSMASATATADAAQTSDRTAPQPRRILAVAPVGHPGGAEIDLLRRLARRVLHVHDVVMRVRAMWRRAQLVLVLPARQRFGADDYADRVVRLITVTP